MEKEHYRYIVFQGIGAIIINFILNAAIAMALNYSVNNIPLWGILGMMSDFLVTIFVLTFLTSLILTPITYKTIAAGKIPVSKWKRDSHFLLRKLPHKIFLRSIVFGLTFFVVLTPIVIFAVTISGIKEMELWNFVIFKGIYASILAAIVTPIIALAALGESSYKSNVVV